MPMRVTRSDIRRRIQRMDNQFRREALGVLSEYGNVRLNTFNAVVSDWDHKPRFNLNLVNKDDVIGFKVEATGQHANIWDYVNEGTGMAGGFRSTRYPIRPKRPGGRLKFRTGYRARTAPNAQFGVGDGSRTGDFVTTDLVLHPGIEPRDFTKKADEVQTEPFRQDIHNAFRRAVRRV